MLKGRKKWKERQKEENKEKFLEKEQKRKRSSYVPHGELSGEKLNDRRQKKIEIDLGLTI